MPWTEKDLTSILTNPYYCLRSIDQRLFGEHETAISEEDYIKSAVIQIEERGAETFVRALIANLKGEFTHADDNYSPYGYRLNRN